MRPNFVAYLEGVLNETKGAAYYGGTLSWGIDKEYTVGLNMDGKGFMIVGGKEEIIQQTPEEHMLVAKNYLKYKDEKCAFWKQAQEVVGNNANQF